MPMRVEGMEEMLRCPRCGGTHIVSRQFDVSDLIGEYKELGCEECCYIFDLEDAVPEREEA